MSDASNIDIQDKHEAQFRQLLDADVGLVGAHIARALSNLNLEESQGKGMERAAAIVDELRSAGKKQARIATGRVEQRPSHPKCHIVPIYIGYNDGEENKGAEQLVTVYTVFNTETEEFYLIPYLPLKLEVLPATIKR